MDGHGQVEQQRVFARVLKVEQGDQFAAGPKERVVGKYVAVNESAGKRDGDLVPQLLELLDKEAEHSGRPRAEVCGKPRDGAHPEGVFRRHQSPAGGGSW